MKIQLRHIRLLWIIALVAFIGLVQPVVLLAQDVGTNAIPIIGTPNAAASMATPFIVSLANKYTIIVSILVVVGIMRMIFKPIMSLIESIVKATPSDKDDLFLSKCEASAWYRWLWWVLDWLGSIKPPGSSTTNPAITKQGNT
jgi:hypothetical protein